MEAARQTYPEYKNTAIPGFPSLPKHWQVARLKHLCDYHSLYGANIPASEYRDTGVRFLRTTDITDEGLLTNEGVYLPTQAVAEYILGDGDILLSRSGTVGRSFLYRHKIHGPCAYAGYLVRFVPKSHPLANYIHLFTKTTAFTEFIRTSAISSTIDNVNAEKYANCRLPLPPPDEQAAIVRYLDHADELINRYISAKERLIALLEEQRKTVIHQAVTRGLHPNVSLTPSGIPSLGDVPAHWDLRRAKFTYQESDQRSYSGVEELMSVSHITGVTPRKQNVTMFLAQSNEGYKLCRPGDIVVNTMWAYMAALGVARQSGLVSPSYGVYRPRVDGLVNPEYMDLLLRTENYRVEYTRRSKGITASRLRLYPDDFLDIPFLRPPTDEQTHIVKYLRRATANVDSTMDRTHRQIALMNECRTRLIADVVTGQIDVRDAAIDLPN